MPQYQAAITVISNLNLFESPYSKGYLVIFLLTSSISRLYQMIFDFNTKIIGIWSIVLFYACRIG